MKAVLTSPFNKISKQSHSHRAAQAVMYYDQLKSDGLDITLDYGQIDNFDKFDQLYVYHGNDWSGTLNLFGGMKSYSNIDSVIRYSDFHGKVFSLVIDHPDYHAMLQKRIDKAKEINPLWNYVNWDQLLNIQNNSIKYIPNDYKTFTSKHLIVGDSHAICMYRPKWKVNSIPFKTLHGALSVGLSNLLVGNISDLDEIGFYFGNIDIRHHLCRYDDDATISLVHEYFKQASEMHPIQTIKIYEPLPIENESRSLPKTGYYKGTPFYGSWEERNRIRNLFIKECKKLESVFSNVKFIQWTDYLCNSVGELDFQYMEKPKSVHLSRAAYPYWQGPNFNEDLQISQLRKCVDTPPSTLEDLFDET
jgi:hypothetical protein